MSAKSDKASGMVNEAVGKFKQAVGSLTGSGDLKARGAAQELEGRAQVALGDVKDAVGGVVDKFHAASTEDRVRDRAYRIWEEEGRPHGRDQAHWEQAEREERN